uniref:Type IV pilus assembly protein PilF n=1 Tax=Candidatus Kentrum sp. TUN TaxID=2126343 RepID=A0A450ZTW2_9GAMM|nr:MAG: type IV pilus assembly protein PilF [Candidatus Kentron sp. TUN]VFK60556.1 MAG: type IV pilus assembly protein PilF [Candidatus Kentron sp. TUN]VFK65245.1 MAG: type IV pilus assembly protein PilF [Candidatus Kentron sp. TUN]
MAIAIFITVCGILPLHYSIHHRIFFLLVFLPLVGCVANSNLPNTPDRETQRNHLVELHTQLAVADMEKGNYKLAQERLDRALRIKPGYPDTHNALGFLYRKLNQPKKAEWYYRRAISLDPYYSVAYNNLGVLLCITGRQADADGYFLKAIANPGYREPEVAMSNAGDCAYSIGDLQKAETYLRRALSFNMKLPAPLLTMAQLYFSKGRGLLAREYLKHYLNVGTHSSRSLWLGIQIERLLDNQDVVSSYILLLRTHYPNSQETRLLRESGIH